MDQGFARIDADLRSLNSGLSSRIDRHGADLGSRIDRQGADLSSRIDAQGASLNARIDALQRTMLQIGGGMIAAILVAAVSLIAAG